MIVMTSHLLFIGESIKCFYQRQENHFKYSLSCSLTQIGYGFLPSQYRPHMKPQTAYQTLGYTFDSYNTTTIEMGQVYVDNDEYTAVTSIAECILTEESWYFDITAQKLYVHPSHDKRMDASESDSLQVRGYSNDHVFEDENGFIYLPYMTSTPSISDEVDRIEFEKLSLTTNDITFSNASGEFDYAFTSPVPGADVNLFYISEEDYQAGKKTLTPLYTGYVSSETITTSEYSVEVEDKRGQLNGKIPNTYFSDDDYPDIEDDLIDELIPEVRAIY